MPAAKGLYYEQKSPIIEKEPYYEQRALRYDDAMSPMLAAKEHYYEQKSPIMCKRALR